MTILLDGGRSLISTTGNVNAGNALISGDLTVVGNINGNLTVTSAQTVTANAQPNITSVGTLVNLTSNGNITINTGGYFIGDGSQLTNLPGSSYGNSNVTTLLSTGITSNITTTANINTNGLFVGPGNSSGYIQANTGSLPFYLRSSDSSPRILIDNSGLSFDLSPYVNLGNVANVKLDGGTNGYVLQTDGAGNISWTAQTGGGGNGVPGGSNTQLQYNNAGAFGGIATVTWDGSNLSLGSVANVKITGGSNTQVLSTDGAGNLSWANYSGGSISNGTSNITIVPSGNINFSANGAPNVLVINNTGIFVTGNANVSGNVNANIVNANYFVGDGSNLSNINGSNVIGNVTSAVTANFANYAGNITVSAQPNITSVGTLTGLDVSGNAVFTGANVSLGSISNLHISGGTSGYVLTTDGVGGLSWGAGGNALSGGGTFLFTQAVATTTWVIQHNLNTQFLNIQMVDATGNSWTGRYDYPTINFTNANTITATFSTAQAGYAAIIAGTAPFGTGISNGNSSVIVTANGNVLTNVAGVANVFVVSGIGANLTGILEATHFLGEAGNLSNIQGGNVVGTVSSATVSASANAVAGTNVSGEVAFAATANSVAGGNVSGAVGLATFAGTANSVAGGNVSGAVGLATFAGTANAVAGANVSGEVPYAAIANSVAAGNIVGTVDLATFATTANSVAGANVSGAVGSATFADTANSVAGANVTGTVANATVAASANSVAGANVSGQVGNALIAGTVYTNTQPNITSVGTLTGLTSNGNITVQSGNFFVGDGGYISNLQIAAGSEIINGNSNVSVAANGNVTTSVAGTANVMIVTATGLAVAGNIIPPTSNVYSLGNTTNRFSELWLSNSTLILGNAVVGADANGAVTMSNGAIITGNLTITGNSNISGNINQISGNSGQFFGDSTGNGAMYTGIATGFTPLPRTIIQSTGSANSYMQINLQNIDSGTGASSDFVVTADNGDDNNFYLAMGIGGSTFDGSQVTNGLANVIGQNDAWLYAQGSNTSTTGGGNLVLGTTTGTKVVKIVSGGQNTNNLVAVFNAPNTVSSNTTTGAVVITGGLGVSGNISGAFLRGDGGGLANIQAGNVVGSIANATTAGTVITNAQPNITSTGTLVNLTVTGNITSTTGVFTGDGGGLSNINIAAGSEIVNGTSNVVVAASGNVTTSVGGTANVMVVTATGANITGNVSATLFIGAGNNLSNIQGANVTGTVANATFATTAGTANSVAGANVTGTVANATFATTSGTANSVAGANVTGEVGFAATANSVAGSNVTGQVSFAATANAVAGGNVTGQVGNALVAGTVYTNAQPNITSVGTLGNLSVTGNVGAAFFNGNITSLTTGATATAGTVVGQWTLDAGSTFNATYADLGERYATDQAYEAGTVLMLGGSAEVTVATNENPLSIAGIVSTDPAYVLNSRLENSVIIALAGRVPCKVVGTIKKGDVLTISDIPGVATSTQDPRYGTIIARALEAYDSLSVGKIEVKVDRG